MRIAPPSAAISATGIAIAPIFRNVQKLTSSFSPPVPSPESLRSASSQRIVASDPVTERFGPGLHQSEPHWPSNPSCVRLVPGGRCASPSEERSAVPPKKVRKKSAKPVPGVVVQLRSRWDHEHAASWCWYANCCNPITVSARVTKSLELTCAMQALATLLMCASKEIRYARAQHPIRPKYPDECSLRCCEGGS